MMMARVLALWLCAVIATAIFAHRAAAHELPCMPKERAVFYEQSQFVRGYGTTREGLVKLSVTSSGAWMLTFSPPEMNGAVCIVWLGENWEFVTAGSRRAERDD